MSDHIVSLDCFDFVDTLDNGSVDLVLTDPPYYGIVKDSWDNQWTSPEHFAEWLYRVFAALKPKLKPTGSLVFFGGIGKHNERPLFQLIQKLESTGLYQYRNHITWQKRRAYGKSHDYLFCREEILWYSVSSERTAVTFNVPHTAELRGYDGWNSKHKAKSPYKRVSNVWSDIPELLHPERSTQKPLPLMERLVSTHSNPGDLIVDPFCGWGSTGVAALKLNRNFRGSEKIKEDAVAGNERCSRISNSFKTVLSCGLATDSKG